MKILNGRLALAAGLFVWVGVVDIAGAAAALCSGAPAITLNSYDWQNASWSWVNAPGNHSSCKIEIWWNPWSTSWWKRNTVAATPSTFADYSLSPGGHYSYRFRAINPNNPADFSSDSNIVSFVSLFAPPFNVSAAQISLTGVQLTFLDANAKERGYEIQRAVNGGAFATISVIGSGAGSGNLSYIDHNVFIGMTVAYRVRAVGRNPNGPSAWANSNSILVH